MSAVGVTAVFTVCGKREALLDCVADLVGKVAPSSQGALLKAVKIAPEGSRLLQPTRKHLAALARLDTRPVR